MTPLDAVTATHFASRPDSQRMIVLRTAVNDNLRRDLATQLQVAGRVLPGSAERVRDLVAALRIDRRINPAVFTCHHQIATGLRRQDAGRVASALGALSRLLEASPYAEGFQIGTVMWDFTDAEILAFLCGREGPRTSRGEFPEVLSPVRIRLSQVLPRPDPQSARVTDGTGLAVHTDHNKARYHAVAELLERTLLAQLWYRAGLPMQPVSQPQGGDHCQARTWVMGGGDAWFAVADAVDHTLPAYSLGAAVRHNRDSAVTHAFSEAVMLLDSAQRGASPPHVQDLARKRASSLAGPLALRRREHLDRMIERTRPIDVQGYADLWLHARIQPQDVTVAHVLTGPDWTLVRAMAENALLLRDARHRHEFSGVVSDPLC